MMREALRKHPRQVLDEYGRYGVDDGDGRAADNAAYRIVGVSERAKLTGEKLLFTLSNRNEEGLDLVLGEGGLDGMCNPLDDPLKHTASTEFASKVSFVPLEEGRTKVRLKQILPSCKKNNCSTSAGTRTTAGSAAAEADHRGTSSVKASSLRLPATSILHQIDWSRECFDRKTGAHLPGNVQAFRNPGLALLENPGSLSLDDYALTPYSCEVRISLSSHAFTKPFLFYFASTNNEGDDLCHAVPPVTKKNKNPEESMPKLFGGGLDGKATVLQSYNVAEFFLRIE
eukprot:g5013.t1